MASILLLERLGLAFIELLYVFAFVERQGRPFSSGRTDSNMLES